MGWVLGAGGGTENAETNLHNVFHVDTADLAWQSFNGTDTKFNSELFVALQFEIKFKRAEI